MNLEQQDESSIFIPLDNKNDNDYSINYRERADSDFFGHLPRNGGSPNPS